MPKRLRTSPPQALSLPSKSYEFGNSVNAGPEKLNSAMGATLRQAGPLDRTILPTQEGRLQTWPKATIDPQIDAGDVCGNRADKKGDSACNVFEPSDPRHWNLRKHGKYEALDIRPRRVRIL